VSRIQESWELSLDGGRTIRSARLANWVEKVEQLRDSMKKLVTRGYPQDALRAALLGGLTDKKALADKNRVEEVAHVLEAIGFRGVMVSQDDEHGTRVLSFTSRRDGVERQVRIDWNLVTSVEFRSLAGNAPGLEALAAKKFALRKGEAAESEAAAAEAAGEAGEATADAAKSKPAKKGKARPKFEPVEVENLDDAMETLYAGAKKGLSIQRYKGLGEMNAEQLWETTMDPQRRRLLQVKIEDDIEADAIFTILMGDLVEPRREFIETNALNVRNLDV